MWLLNALATGIAVFCALELHVKADKRRETNGGKLINIPNALLPKSEKTEFLPPMTDDEYYAYMNEESSNGQLLKGVLAKKPWTSKGHNSPSSDS